ncbi:MAG: hypothetical protein LKJ88_03700 [Bacilli bacterium]|jgi:hypothetical protein|nr:hypothetical protein [Bacilli bacterium]
MKKTNKEIEEDLLKASSSFEIPDLKEQIKKDYKLWLNEQPVKPKKAEAKKKWVYPVILSSSLAMVTLLVVFATPVRDAIFASSTLPSYDTYTLQSKQQQVVASVSIGASYLASSESTTILKPAQTEIKSLMNSADRPGHEMENREAYIEEINNYMPSLEIALASYNASVASFQPSASTYKYGWDVSQTMANGDIVNQKIHYDEKDAGDQTYDVSGLMVHDDNLSFPFSIKRTENNADYFISASVTPQNDTSKSVTLTEMKDDRRPDMPEAHKILMTYKSNERTDTIEMCLGKHEGNPTAETRILEGDRPLDFIVEQKGASFNVFSSHGADDMGRFFITIESDSTGATYYNYHNNEFSLKKQRS